jgi:hypothetical protein
MTAPEAPKVLIPYRIFKKTHFAIFLKKNEISKSIRELSFLEALNDRPRGSQSPDTYTICEICIFLLLEQKTCHFQN